MKIHFEYCNHVSSWDDGKPLGYNCPQASEFLDILWRNGFRQAEKQIDPPKPAVPEVSLPSRYFPSTLLGIRNRPSTLHIAHLGKVVSQLPSEGYVGSSVYPTLLRHLASLAEAFDTLRQELLKIPVDTLHRADEEVTGKK